MGGQLLEGVISFYKNTSASVQVNGELSATFNVEVGVRQGWVMSPWLFSIYMAGWLAGWLAGEGNGWGWLEAGRLVERMAGEGWRRWLAMAGSGPAGVQRFWAASG